MEEEKQEFTVKIVHHRYGYVKVRARDKNEAKRVTESMARNRLMKFYKHEFDFVNIGEVLDAPQPSMIDIINCKLEGQVNETPIFEVKGTYDNDSFHCRLELRLNDPDLDDLDFEHLEGVDLGPMGLDVLEELVNEITETEEYQEASEELERVSSDPDALLD
jgi:hypothetical protein